jgi:hypothetical protein
MKLEQFVLTLGGIAIIVAFLLPYVTLNLNPTAWDVIPSEIKINDTEIKIDNISALDSEVEVSGLSMTQSLLNKADVIEEGIDNGWLDWIWNAWQENASSNTQLKVAGLLFVLAGPFLFLLYALGYLFRGLTGKQYKRGVFTTLLFLGASWAIFKFLLGFNFFEMAGPGFWVAFGGMLLAAFSLFFERGKK